LFPGNSRQNEDKKLFAQFVDNKIFKQLQFFEKLYLRNPHASLNRILVRTLLKNEVEYEFDQNFSIMMQNIV